MKRILVTNDLTEPVLDEAIRLECNMIVTYHPAIFGAGLKRLTQSEWKQWSIVRCIEQRIAVYSPHTSWDAVSGGINDWLINQFDPESVEPIESIVSSATPSGFSKSVRVDLAGDLEAIKDFKNIVQVCNVQQSEFLTDEKGVVELISAVRAVDKRAADTLRVVDLAKVSD